MTRNIRIMAVVACTVALGALARVQAASVPRSERVLARQTAAEIQQGDELKGQVLAKSRLVQGTPFNDVMTRVFARLVATPEVAARQLPYEVFLVSSDEANAFCVPGGKVFVYSGITSLTGMDENLWAALLSHELAHAVRSHAVSQEKGAQRLEKTSRILHVLGRLAPALGQSADVAKYAEHAKRAGRVAYGMDFLSPFLMRKFSRSDESDADAQGMLYSAKAGFDPEGAIQLHKNLMNQFGDSKAFLTFLNTHPRESKRIEKLQALLPVVRSMAQEADASTPQVVSLSGATN